MKKQLTALLTATLLLTSLTGCTNENSSTSDNSSVADTSSSVTSDNTESTESGTSAETSDLTQSLPKAVEIGDKMILTGTLLEHSQLENFSVETLVRNYTLTEDEKNILDSVGVSEIKDLYITAVVLSDFSKNPEKFQTSAATANNRTPATIVNTRFPKRYYQTGYTYESVYNEYLKAFEGGEGESFFKVDFCIEHNKEFFSAKTSDEVEKREVHKEYKIAYQDDSYIKIRKTSFSYDKNFKPATEYKPDLRYEYDITVTEYMFDLTENGWQVKKPVSSKINGKSVDDVIYDEALYASVFGGSVFDSVVDITPENDWVIDAFIAEAKKYGKKVLNPDGTELDPSLAVRASGSNDSVGTLIFDFAYIAYAEPNLTTSIDNPDMESWEEFRNRELQSPPDKKRYVKIKAGDVLENGLKVKTAYYGQDTCMGEDGDYLSFTRVETEGELTLNGILIRASKQEYEGYEMSPYQEGQIYFIPYGADVPVHDITIHSHYIDSVTEDFKAVSDAPLLRVGKIDEMPQEMLDDLDAFFKDGDVVKAKVTIKDPIMGYALGPGLRYYADLVSFEKHDW